MLTPWRATLASRRWFALTIAALCVLGAVVIGVVMPGPRRWLACAMLYAVGMFFLWALWLSATLLLAIDARRLGLPRMQKAAIHGLACYAVLTIGLPVVALHALPNTDSGLAALIAASAAMGGLAFALLPVYVISLVCLLPALHSSLKLALPLLNLLDLSRQGWFVSTLLVLAVIVVWRWRQLVHGDADRSPGLRKPLVLQLHWLNSLGSNMDTADVQVIRQRPIWLQPSAALRNAGPHSRVLALRIALGGHYLPNTLASHLRAAAFTLLQMLVVSLMLALVLADKHGMASLRENFGLAALASIGGSCLLGGPSIALLISVQLQQRWQRPQAELSLLALLPGLGDAGEQRGQLLRASLAGPTVSLALVLLVVLAGALMLRLHGLGLLLLALPTLASLGVIVMQALRIYGGRPLPAWGVWLLFVPLTALIALSLLFPILSIFTHAQFATMESRLLLAWLVAALVLVWLIQRGWHAFQRRPHPFLPNVA